MLSMKSIESKSISLKTDKPRSYPLPNEVIQQVKDLGLRIRHARLQRQWRQVDLAKRSDLSRTAIEAIERGEPTTSIGTYIRVLWAMGLNREVDLLADPGLDRDGLALQFSVENKRVSLARKLDNDF